MNWREKIEAQIADLIEAADDKDDFLGKGYGDRIRAIGESMQALKDVAVAAETASLCLSHELGCPEHCVKCDINHGIDKLREAGDE